MMLEKPLIIFKAVILFFFLISFSYAELLNPNSTISPKEVIKIQLSGLQQNDLLDKDKIYHKFNWQVEKYTSEGTLKDCWLTTMVSSPIPLGSSI